MWSQSATLTEKEISLGEGVKIKQGKEVVDEASHGDTIYKKPSTHALSTHTLPTHYPTHTLPTTTHPLTDHPYTTHTHATHTTTTQSNIIFPEKLAESIKK